MKTTSRIKKYLHRLSDSATLHRHIKRLRNLTVLPCSLGIGLIPPLLWLLAINLWQSIELLPAANWELLTLAVLLLSPFAAGFAQAQQRPQSEVFNGALPAFILWLLGMALYNSLFTLPDRRTLLITLLAAVLLGIAGAMSSHRITAIRSINAQKKKAEE